MQLLSIEISGARMSTSKTKKSFPRGQNIEQPSAKSINIMAQARGERGSVQLGFGIKPEPYMSVFKVEKYNRNHIAGSVSVKKITSVWFLLFLTNFGFISVFCSAAQAPDGIGIV